MNIGKVISSGKTQVEDYSKVDPKTLLNEGAKAHETLNYAWAVLLLQVSLLVKEVTANGVSERAKHIEAEAAETLREYRILRSEATAIESEIIRRIWHNKTNGYFAKFKIGLLRNDYKAQEEALWRLQKVLGSIPWTNEWFHAEGNHGMDSLTNLLLAKELPKYQNLDLPATLEYAMNNKFGYLYLALKRDFLDEIDKYRSRPFERYRELDEPNESEGQAGDARDNPDNLIIENLDRERRVIRLREAANKETNTLDQRIIGHAADLLADNHLLVNASRAGVVTQVCADFGVTPQYLRRRLGTDRLLARVKQALQLTDARSRLVLSDTAKKK